MLPTVTTRLVPRSAPPRASHRRMLLGAMALFAGGYVTTEAIFPAWLHGDTGPIPYVVPAACAFANGDLIALQADTGEYVALDNTTDVAAVVAPAVAPSATWKVYNTGRLGTLALQADSGKFLARCRNTPAAIVDANHWSDGAYAQWTCVVADDGRIALKADTGKFLVRDRSATLVHAESWADAKAQWAVDRLPVSPACTFANGDVVGLKSDIGTFMGRCDDCLAIPRAVFAHAPSMTPEATWTVFNTDNGKLVFRGDDGTYLNREYKLVPGASVVDQAFSRVAQAKPWAEFTCVDLGNGAIGLEADNGKFLSRCSDCYPGAKHSESVAMDTIDASRTSAAHWTVVRHA
ncbi:hypothetical protein SPRG_12727 [Saprolegnia parasitica CBS 223.65]|uniref:Fascin domain-containing protein n=1 Tax=Saprolegnia parasitica (strain CBS 223.65) TaxID=695850 RepID=A0A067C7B5_SAPPC|nr:hypothetical protein SPRG_12727 [Saprolegnia parasitica CBS 223.65]KDO22446.1 hypothetical protein SPRG_12727 [Saprolegnia parasitica CBS 223.65]|eukprot:XP_012206834.1 hypothetical protein SPRG_12727 [Saprolegnia parasitica CBS 223.65]